MERFVYKIEDATIWAAAMKVGVYKGSELDVKDGFIHLSSSQQSQRTLDLHFAKTQNLIIAKIDLMALDGEIKWEPSRGGVLFPHIYGDLPKAAVIKTLPIIYSADGEQKIPAEIFASA